MSTLSICETSLKINEILFSIMEYLDAKSNFILTRVLRIKLLPEDKCKYFNIVRQDLSMYNSWIQAARSQEFQVIIMGSDLVDILDISEDNKWIYGSKDYYINRPTISLFAVKIIICNEPNTRGQYSWLISIPQFIDYRSRITDPQGGFWHNTRNTSFNLLLWLYPSEITFLNNIWCFETCKYHIHIDAILINKVNHNATNSKLINTLIYDNIHPQILYYKLFKYISEVSSTNMKSMRFDKRMIVEPLETQLVTGTCIRGDWFRYSLISI